MDKNRKDKSPQGKTYTLEELQGRPPRTIWAVIAMLGLITIAVGTLLPIFAVRIGSTHTQACLIKKLITASTNL